MARKSWSLRITSALLLAVLLALVVTPALAASNDPSITSKWGSFGGRFPVTVTVTDCSRLNLRSSASLSARIVTTVSRGTQLTATGRDGTFIRVVWQGQTVYGYAAYLTPGGNGGYYYVPPQIVVPPVYRPPVYKPAPPSHHHRPRRPWY